MHMNTKFKLVNFSYEMGNSPSIYYGLWPKSTTSVTDLAVLA